MSLSRSCLSFVKTQQPKESTVLMTWHGRKTLLVEWVGGLQTFRTSELTVNGGCCGNSRTRPQTLACSWPNTIVCSRAWWNGLTTEPRSCFCRPPLPIIFRNWVMYREGISVFEFHLASYDKPISVCRQQGINIATAQGSEKTVFARWF